MTKRASSDIRARHPAFSSRRLRARNCAGWKARTTPPHPHHQIRDAGQEKSRSPRCSPTVARPAIARCRHEQAQDLPALRHGDELPARGVHPAEAWPMFQQAWLTAKALGISPRHPRHDVHGDLELQRDSAGWTAPPASAPATADHRRRGAILFTAYQGDGSQVPRDRQVVCDRHQIKRSDELVKGWRIPSTPSLVINGRYLINNQEVGSWDGMARLVISWSRRNASA